MTERVLMLSALSPFAERLHDWAELAPPDGQYVFRARRVLLVEPPLDDAVLFQLLEPGRERVRANSGE